MSVAAFAPATVSNVACGFDVLGFALDEPGDVVMAAPADAPGVSIVDIVGDDGRLPRDSARNTAGAAVAALLQHLQTTRGIALTIHKGLPLESGIGSSGASAVAAVVAETRPVPNRHEVGPVGGASAAPRKPARTRRNSTSQKRPSAPSRIWRLI